MSFSSQVKDELAHLNSASKCCRLAELSATLRMDGAFHIQKGTYAFHISTESAPSARKALKFLSELFGLTAEVTTRRSLFRKSNNYIVYVPPQLRLNQALNELGVLDDSMLLRYGVLPRLVKKDCCAMAYLRGAFLGGGSISSPQTEYHFELSTDNREFAQGLKGLLRRFGLDAKISERRKNYAVYLTKADQIIQFLALVGAYRALLTWEDVRTLKEVRNQVNRLVNCDTANLNKAAQAAVRQLSDITLIDKEVGLASLTPSLREIAQARIKHPYANIGELGRLFNPPLSKSAVYHRVRRLAKLAQDLRKAS